MIDSQQKKIIDGLYSLQSLAKKFSENSILKLIEMQEAYFRKASTMYSDKEKDKCRYYLKALIHKFHLANLSLEQLWALCDNKRIEIYEAVELSLNKMEISDNEMALISFTFETFMFHARAYIDFYMLYICYLLQTGHTGYINIKKFQRAMEKIGDPSVQIKASQAKNYFENEVFGQGGNSTGGFSTKDWGNLIISIRDKIAHRDLVQPSFDSQEKLAEQIVLELPTIKGMTYERFIQTMQNGMYELIQNMAEILYEIKWVPGPYKPNMFDSI